VIVPLEVMTFCPTFEEVLRSLIGDFVAKDVVGTGKAVMRNKVVPIVIALISENIVPRAASSYSPSITFSWAWQPVHICLHSFR
jgi:hypothetical protein